MAGAEAGQAAERGKARLARFLLTGAARICDSAGGKRLLIEHPERGTISILRGTLEAMARAGLVCHEGGELHLSNAGVAFARRSSAPTEPFRAQHAMLENRIVEMPAGRQKVTANVNESPLSKLAYRRNRNGEPFLTATEFRAGERLRADFTRGQIMPRVGMNWQRVAVSERRGGAGGMAELTDAALAARQRVEQALAAIGPELADVTVDICCFLKGLELVETERGWPVRSAKVVLKTALAALARHYEPRGGASSRERRILHWGAADYRPRVGG